MPKIVQVLTGMALAATLVLWVGAAAFAQTSTPLKRVPGPIAGAGVPIIAVSLGAYWLVRRDRRKSQ
jgi:hypothetical protein